MHDESYKDTCVSLYFFLCVCVCVCVCVCLNGGREEGGRVGMSRHEGTMKT